MKHDPMDDLVRRGDVIKALHSGNISVWFVSRRTWLRLRELSEKIDDVIMRVPGWNDEKSLHDDRG